ncbi:hypothetical protein PABG_12420 [Paracoccidioides brasiliensis Pb03]|nr:hypothetical protein PABG_12420 [Paracoccidioides brasiliensis Pb03]
MGLVHLSEVAFTCKNRNRYREKILMRVGFTNQAEVTQKTKKLFGGGKRTGSLPPQTPSSDTPIYSDISFDIVTPEFRGQIEYVMMRELVQEEQQALKTLKTLKVLSKSRAAGGRGRGCWALAECCNAAF